MANLIKASTEGIVLGTSKHQDKYAESGLQIPEVEAPETPLRLRESGSTMHAEAIPNELLSTEQSRIRTKLRVNSASSATALAIIIGVLVTLALHQDRNLSEATERIIGVLASIWGL